MPLAFLTQDIPRQREKVAWGTNFSQVEGFVVQDAFPVEERGCLQGGPNPTRVSPAAISYPLQAPG